MWTDLIKRRRAKKSNRGIYVQDKELEKSLFKPQTHYKYTIDPKEKQVLITPSENEKDNTVSQRSVNNTVKPVIDIRNKEALFAFAGSDYLEIEIYQNQVVVTGKKEIQATQNNIIDITSQITFSKDELEKAVGENYLASSTVASMAAISTGDLSQFISFKHQFQDLKIPFQVASLFSGAGIMDLGFIEKGFDIVFAIEKDLHAATTYRENLGDHVLCEDIVQFNETNNLTAPVIIGGPPCQGFSNANRRTNFLENPKNQAVFEFIKAVRNNKNAKVFILENVPRILTAGDGYFKKEIYEALSDFEITSGVLNAAHYGSAQKRKRAIFIGSKIGKIDLPTPEILQPESYQTVGDAFTGINDTLPNQRDITKSKPETIDRMKYVPQGGNWENIPMHLFPNDKEKHSDLYRRLDANAPSVSLANFRKQVITHPWLHRIISVREAARLFGVPDDFVFLGTKNAKEQQVANAVPVELAKAIAQAVRSAIVKYNRKVVFA